MDLARQKCSKSAGKNSGNFLVLLCVIRHLKCMRTINMLNNTCNDITTNVSNFGALVASVLFANTLIRAPLGSVEFAPRWGGADPSLCDLSEYWAIFEIQTPFDSPGHELSDQGRKFDLKVFDDVTGQVKI